MFASKLMSQFANLSNGVYSPRFGGVISEDKKSYIKILKANFYTEDYEKVKLLKKYMGTLILKRKISYRP